MAAHARLRLPSFHFLLQQFVETLSCVLEDDLLNVSCCVHGPLKRASCLPLGFALGCCFVVVVEAAGNGSSDSSYDYDMITIGAGSGGVRASRFATSYGV